MFLNCKNYLQGFSVPFWYSHAMRESYQCWVLQQWFSSNYYAVKESWLFLFLCAQIKIFILEVHNYPSLFLICWLLFFWLLTSMPRLTHSLLLLLLPSALHMYTVSASFLHIASSFPICCAINRLYSIALSLPDCLTQKFLICREKDLTHPRGCLGFLV